MIEALAGPGAGEVDDLTARDLLASITALARAAEDRAAADLLGRSQPGGPTCTRRSRSIDAATFTVPGCEHEEPIAGEGAPLVAEFCLAELGTVLGISTTAAKKLVGHALELRHRLPRLWAQVQAGRVPAWRARVGRGGHHPHHPGLTARGRGVRRCAGRRGRRAGRSGTAGPARRRGDQALRPRRVDPAADPEDGYLHVDPRHATIHDDDVHFAGTMRLEAELDIADALDLDRALAHGAATPEGARVRGVARRPPLRRPRRPRPHPDRARPPRPRRRDARDARRPAGRSRGRPPRPLRCVRSTGWPPCSVRPAGMEEGQRLVLLDQVKDWCGDSRTKITVKPVIDLNADLSTPALRGPRPDPRAGHPPGQRHVCSRGAPDPPGAATSTTSSRTTPTPRLRADHSPARRRPPTSPRCAASTTASRPTPPGATG